MTKLIFTVMVMFSLISLQASAGMMDFDAYRMLEIGTSEGEVLARAGPPDREIEVRIEKENDDTYSVVRELTYIPYPDQEDPHITVITIKKGKVIAMDRNPVMTSPYFNP
ncbi:MAG: hypothetical protein HY200_01585 [Nitrospirae bacterium]|nr:hypothetical protein [Nitrospirota bacterium]MBI3593628.1 hypothetical protein [Nitrospirota bacterium]